MKRCTRVNNFDGDIEECIKPYDSFVSKKIWLRK